MHTFHDSSLVELRRVVEIDEVYQVFVEVHFVDVHQPLFDP